jgi:GNAT superfamily N-acetyltransferase
MSDTPILHIPTFALPSALRRKILSLCAAAYDEDLSPYFEWIGPGVHLCACQDDALVSHLMIVERALQPGSVTPLRTGYVELVATHPAWQGQGLATGLLRAAEPQLDRFDLAALSPSSASFYERLGWEPWRGPLFVRRDGTLQATPDEEVMIRRTITTPELDLDAPLSVEWREGEIW